MLLKDFNDRREELEETLFLARKHTFSVGPIPMSAVIFHDCQTKIHCCCLPVGLEGVDIISETRNGETVAAYAVILDQIIELDVDEADAEIYRQTKIKLAFERHNFDCKEGLETPGLSKETSNLLRNIVSSIGFRIPSIADKFTVDYFDRCEIARMQRKNTLDGLHSGYAKGECIASNRKLDNDFRNEQCRRQYEAAIMEKKQH